MKKSFYLPIALLLTVSLNPMARADDMTITITKATETTAKVMPSQGKGMTSIVPISFDSGASWDDLKDTYTVSSDTASLLGQKKETISIGSDGTASFHPMKIKKK